MHVLCFWAAILVGGKKPTVRAFSSSSSFFFGALIYPARASRRHSRFLWWRLDDMSRILVFVHVAQRGLDIPHTKAGHLLDTGGQQSTTQSTPEKVNVHGISSP